MLMFLNEVRVSLFLSKVDGVLFSLKFDVGTSAIAKKHIRKTAKVLKRSKSRPGRSQHYSPSPLDHSPIVLRLFKVVSDISILECTCNWQLLGRRRKSDRDTNGNAPGRVSQSILQCQLYMRMDVWVTLVFVVPF